MQNKIVQGTTIPEIMQNLPYIAVPPNFSSMELFIHACLHDLFTNFFALVLLLTSQPWNYSSIPVSTTYSLPYFYELRNLAFTDEENFAAH